MSSIVWFRQDLRLRDNPALAAAIEQGEPVVPVYLWSPGEEGEWSPGAAARWWLHYALEDLRAELENVGSRLIVRQSRDCLKSLRELVDETGARRVYWNRRYEPSAIARDSVIRPALRDQGLEAESFNGGMLFEPHEIANRSGKPFQVFTPLWKHYETLAVPTPVEVDLTELRPPGHWPPSEPIEGLNLRPQIPWDGGIHEHWDPTRSAVLGRLEDIGRDGRAQRYPDDRDIPSIDGTSHLSPYLHSGQIGIREAWALLGDGEPIRLGLRRQLVWREFAHHLLFHFPSTPAQPLRGEFELFPWREDERALRCWQRGETGYPIVDAGMKQLWHTGWMHNRVRMVVGSLLVKHLLVHWAEGARWFWDTLVDADLANNTLGWQWIGGCGADAAPYFRIFNPIAQGERFDPEGAYVKRWLPQLAKLPSKYVHRPWEMGELELAGAGIVLGRDYPMPVVEHPVGRRRALEAYDELKRRRAERAE
ncbi:MAG: cryptochrome/photolyase family protein [Verrucomicrobiales bacterium]